MQDADSRTGRGKIRINAGAVRPAKQIGRGWLGMHQEKKAA